LDEVVAIYERLLGKHARKQYLPIWWLKLINHAYTPFNEAKARAIAICHDLAKSNWQIDMSETMMHYPVQLVCLDEVVRRGVRKS